MNKALFLLVTVLGALYFASATLHKPTLNIGSYGQAPTFTADSLQGEFSSASLADSIWVASFFFTSCKGPCPVINTNIHSLTKHFSEAADVHFVSFTVDPETDTLEQLGSHRARFSPTSENWHFLRTTESELSRLLNEQGFKLGSHEDPVFHSTRVVVVDRNNQIRGFFKGTDAESITQLKKTIEFLRSE